LAAQKKVKLEFTLTIRAPPTSIAGLAGRSHAEQSKIP
jgi:hypothetical protein